MSFTRRDRLPAGRAVTPRRPGRGPGGRSASRSAPEEKGSRMLVAPRRGQVAALLTLVVGLGLATRASGANLTGVVHDNFGIGVANVNLDAIDQCTGASVFLSNDLTASDGSFSIALPNGTYDLHFNPPAGSTLAAGDLQAVVVTTNASLGTISLVQGRLVSGMVLTPTFSPAAGMGLKFIDAATEHRVFLTKGSTDAAGNWSVRVPPGTWNVDFRPPAGSPFADGERLGLVVGGSDISGLSDFLKTGFAVTGHVQNAASVALAEVDLSAFDKCTGNEVPNAHDNTDAAGNFSIVMPAGTYTFTVAPPFCTPSEATRLVDVVVSGPASLGTFTLRNAVTVSGVVHNPDGSAMVDARVKFFDVTLPGIPRQGTARDHTSASGAFAIEVPPGTYDINVEPPVGSTARVIHLPSVAIAGAANLGTLTALAGVAISSHVQGPAAQPVENVNVNVVDHATRVSQHLTHDATDAAGNYRVVVAPGTYDVQYGPPACNGLAPATVDSVVINATTTLPTTSLVTGIHLSGSLADQASAPVAGAALDVLRAGTTRHVYTPDALTAANGSYDVLIAPGQYDFHYLPPAGSRLRPRSVSYPFESGSTTLPPVTLSPGLLLSGSVQDAGTHAGIAGVELQVFPAHQSTPLLTANTETNSLGSFSFPVDNGTWDIRYVPPVGSNYAEAWRRGVVVSADLTLPVQTLAPTSTAVAPPAARALELAPPLPNPARRDVRFTFLAPHGAAKLSVWDVTGRRVATLWNGPAPVPTTVVWNARGSEGRLAPPGIYLVGLTDASGGMRLRRVTLLP